ncbi:MAG TPA: DMT family transporter, partial [Trueperaceae bacterium]|nr:DMT family transporter [Trueperaceae bacterium]
ARRSPGMSQARYAWDNGAVRFTMSPALGLVSLVVVTMIWGTTFVVVKEALDTISVPLLLALRFTLAGLLLAWAGWDRRAVVPALMLGLLSFAGFVTQTIGLSITSASNAAFITGLSVIVTPLVGRLFWRQAVAPRVFAAAVVALAGLALITLRDGVAAINGGDMLVLVTALTYALYIVYLGEVAGKVRGTSLAFMQHVPMALLAWLWAAPQVGDLVNVPLTTLLAIVYLAAVATAGVAIIQTYAQRVVPAHLTALVFVLEPAFAALFAFLVLGERLGPLGWIGGGLMLFAMVIAQVRWPAPRLDGR